MTDQPDAGNKPLVRGNRNLTFQAGGNLRVSRSKIAGRDINITKIKQTIRGHRVASSAVAAVVIGLSVYGGVVVASPDSSVDVSVVSEPGAGGARHTTEQIRTAERVGDADAWCVLVAPGDSGCANSIKGAFAGRSQDYRDKVEHVGIGKTALSGTDAQTPLSWDGKQQGTVPLTWSGGRWQMKQSDYGWVKLAGGVFLSLVDSQTGNLKLGGIPIPS